MRFIQFDVIYFYGSISEELLENAITFAARYTEINESTKNTIKQAAQSFLFSENEFWIKKKVVKLLILLWEGTMVLRSVS